MSKGFKSPLSDLTISTITLYMKRHTYLSVAIISWVVIILLSLFFVIPQIQATLAETTQIGVEQSKLDDATAKVAFLRGLNPQVFESDQALLQTVLPSQKPVTPLISSVEQLAANAGVTIKSFELNPGSVATTSASSAVAGAPKAFVAGVGSLPLKLEVDGGFAQMNIFFKSLNTLVPLINVKTIDFTQLSQNGPSVSVSAQYKATLGLESLYAISDASSTKVDPNAVLTPLSNTDLALIANLTAQVSSQPSPTQDIFTSASQSGVFRSTLFSY